MDLKARRTGSTVTLTFTVPSVNLDNTKPADIGKVEVFAYTAMAQNDVRDVRRMTLVASLPVRKPPNADAGTPGERRAPGEEGRPAAPGMPAVPARPAGLGLEQGALVTVTETLDASMLKPLAPDQKPKAATRAAEPRASVRRAAAAAAGRTAGFGGGQPLLRRLRRQPARQPRRRVPAASRAARRGARCAGETDTGCHRGRRRGEVVRARRDAASVPGARGRGNPYGATYRGMASAPVPSYHRLLAPPRRVPTRGGDGVGCGTSAGLTGAGAGPAHAEAGHQRSRGWTRATSSGSSAVTM